MFAYLCIYDRKDCAKSIAINPSEFFFHDGIGQQKVCRLSCECTFNLSLCCYMAPL